ncbi:hypothetical protein ACT3SZ_05590 [Corynebacterium sp. AOP40-9SA-29]
MDYIALAQQALDAGDWAAYNHWDVAQQVYDATLGRFDWSGVGA